MSTNLHDHVAGLLAQTLNQQGLTSDRKLHGALRLLAKYRSQLIANTVFKLEGNKVLSGPFEGMALLNQVAEGCLVPKLLGCYEQELHPILKKLPDLGLESVINVGCAEGYYAVGLARLLPAVRVTACDIDLKAQRLCETMAEDNGVADQVSVGGLLSPRDFAEFAGRKTLVVCDIEGAEDVLLDPVKAPALKDMHIIAELHEEMQPGLVDKILARFKPSHKIRRIAHGGRDPSKYPVLEKLEALDQLLAVWEWRTGPTPWAWLTPK